MTIKTIKRKDILINQEKNIINKNNTTFRFKSFIDYKNRRVRLYNDDRIVTRKWIIDIYIEEDDRNKIKL